MDIDVLFPPDSPALSTDTFDNLTADLLDLYKSDVFSTLKQTPEAEVPLFSEWREINKEILS